VPRDILILERRRDDLQEPRPCGARSPGWRGRRGSARRLHFPGEVWV